jgi:polysaccharide biosynthesis/export protein
MSAPLITEKLRGETMSVQNRLQIALLLIACFVLTVGAKRQDGSKRSVDSAAQGASSTVGGNSVPGDAQTSLQRRGLRYTVHPTDTLALTFPLTPEFDQTVTVQPDGFISLRGVADLSVAGETLPELTESLTKAYRAILKDPMIYVDPKDYEKPYFVVGGQVGKPGKFDWRGDVTVTQAIAIAGGFLDTSKHSQVLMFRRVSSEWAQAKLINVKHMLSSQNLHEDPLLEPGDMLYVPKNTLSKIKPYIPLPSLGLYSGTF